MIYMELIDKYFKEKTKDLTFIELKDTSKIRIKDFIIEDEIPLPIVTGQLIKNIKEGGLEEEINVSYIIDGIIHLIGIDNNFPYIEEYKGILLSYNEDIKDYIGYEGIKDLEKGDYDRAAIKFRALLILDEENVNALLNYGITLEEIAKNYIMEDKLEDGQMFLKYSTRKIEEILNINKSFAPAYYKLGYHYKYLGQFLKANLTWEKFLLLSKEDLLIQEIREEMEIIKDDVNMETALTYMNYNDYEKALEYFLQLIPKYEENWNINYLIGQTYSGLGQLDRAIEYMDIALNLNPKEVDIYNELGIIYFNRNDIFKAIEIFTEGIDNCEEEYKLYFNRGLGYVQLNEYEKGLRDVNKAFELNPKDDNVKVQKDILEQMVLKG